MNITDGHGICACKLGMNNVVYVLQCSSRHYVLLREDTLENTSGTWASSGTNVNKEQLGILVQDL